MRKDMIVFLDDEDVIVNSAKMYFNELELSNLQLRAFTDYTKFISFVEENRNDIKVWIIDLARNDNEVASGNFSIRETIVKEYKNNRIPIFIHSAQLDRYHDFSSTGTVFKVPKGSESLTTIFDKIELMYNSKFLNIFCKNGRLEKELIELLHNAFTKQFRGDDISKILQSVEKSSESSMLTDRTYEIFKRIGVRTLLQDLHAITLNEESQPVQVEVNAVEYYYRRDIKSLIPVWTGDIFFNNTEKKQVIILTPRCDIAKISDKYLVCEITNNHTYLEALEQSEKKKEEKLRKYTTDANLGERFRYIPKAIRFNGGLVDLGTYQTLSAKELKENYNYNISVVDDLTNDIIRKLASFIMRGGISNMHYPEGISYFKSSPKKKIEQTSKKIKPVYKKQYIKSTIKGVIKKSESVNEVYIQVKVVFTNIRGVENFERSILIKKETWNENPKNLIDKKVLVSLNHPAQKIEGFHSHGKLIIDKDNKIKIFK